MTLVVSWGMLERLRVVLARDLGFSTYDAAELTGLIASYASEGPSLTLGGVGVIPMRDAEDRHVLETGLEPASNILVTANLSDFVQDADEPVQAGRLYRLSRGRRPMILAHPFETAGWLRGGNWPTKGDGAGA